MLMSTVLNAMLKSKYVISTLPPFIKLSFIISIHYKIFDNVDFLYLLIKIKFDMWVLIISLKKSYTKYVRESGR